MTIIQNAGAGRGSFGFYNDTVNQSLRFEDGDNAYLNKTLSASNGTIFTFSCWVKLGNIGINRCLLQGYDDANNFTQILLYSGNQVGIYSATSNTARLYAVTTALLRDTGAWYNIVVKFNGTSSSEEFKIYVNGVNQALTTTTALAAHQSLIGNSNAHYIGNNFNQSLDMDGYMAEVNFIDGTALDAASFGETKDGIWIPKDTSSLTFGTNGFRLQFDQTGTGTASTSTIGADISGNNNHFTSNNLVSTDSNMPDCPENNFATLNLLEVSSTNDAVLSNGNLIMTPANGSGWNTRHSTAYMSSGKWYVEYSRVVNIGDVFGGIIQEGATDANYVGYGANGYGYHVTGVVQKNASNVATGLATYGTDDVIGIALDMDNGTVQWSKNGTFQGSALTGLTGAWGFAVSFTVTGTTLGLNFGQDSSFAGNITSGSAGASDDNGIGDFFNAPPSGFLALCSSNLPELTIGPDQTTQADDHFNTVLYTGNGSSRSITGVGFSPDWIWFKARSGAIAHLLYDSVRGATKYLQANSTSAEGTESNSQTSFDSDGFSLGTDSTTGVNQNSTTYVAWNWLAGTAFSNDASATGVGDTDSEGQVNTKAGFAIIKWTSGGSSVVAHGLGKKPDLIIIKSRDGTENWLVGNSATGFANRTKLNTNDAQGSSSAFSGGVTTTTFTEHIANSSYDKIGYLFANTEGYCKVGTYEGNANNDGTFVYTGFRPAFLLVKSVDSTSDWLLVDDKRIGYNPENEYIEVNNANAEGTVNMYDLVSNGFKNRDRTADPNVAETYLYIAFAGQPFKFANAR